MYKTAAALALAAVGSGELLGLRVSERKQVFQAPEEISTPRGVGQNQHTAVKRSLIGLRERFTAGQLEPPQAPLVGTWVATRMNGRPVVAGAPLIMTFGEGTRVTGNASCNNFSGSYTVEGSKLTFGGTIATRKACENAVLKQETAFLAVLGAVERFEVGRDKSLVLRTGDKRDLVLVRK